ncbi:hypothetical protein GSH06_24830 [Burkholderia pseudomallei]|nr:hypothetical protein [Burkholderia pseudomallei]
MTDSAERDRVYIEATSRACAGMTLRDYFAAKAMRPLTLSMKSAREKEMHSMAREAYAIADAMLRARGA